MACNLANGRTEPCKDQVGGLHAVYFINYDDLDLADVTYSTGDVDVITDLGSGITAYKFELKGTSNLEQTITASRDNGTLFYDQILTLVLHKQDKATHRYVHLLGAGRPRIVVEDYNANAWIVGLENGSDVNGGSISSGSAMGDLTGYNVTFQGQERKPANFLDGAVKDNPFAGLASSVTITTN